MLQLLLSLVTFGTGDAWPVSGASQTVDSAGRPDSVAPMTRAPRSPPLMPALWSNDYGGVTVGLRGRPAGNDDVERGLLVASAATRGGATSSIGLYGRWNNDVARGPRRVATSVAAWSVEGRTGASISFDHSRPHGDIGTDRHIGVVALWMATTNLGYVDRRLWDDAGSMEVGPWLSTVVRRGEAVLRARGAVSLGLVYQHATPPVASGRHYVYHGFNRATGEVSVRTPVARGTTLGARLFAGVYLGPSNPVRQLRVAVAGADPYATFANPLLRSRGALLVRPDFHYHAPGGPNLRGFRNDLGGRWAVGVNLELMRTVARRNAGFLREAALGAFVDLGVADTLAASSSSPRRWYTTLYDGGLGIVTRHQVKDMAWTMRFELPLAVNRWDVAAHDPANSTRFALRWQVSLAPSF